MRFLFCLVLPILFVCSCGVKEYQVAGGKAVFQVSTVRFYRSKTISSGRLDRNANLVVNDRIMTFAKRTYLFFNETGALVSGTLAKPVDWVAGGRRYIFSSGVSFYGNGAVENADMPDGALVKARLGGKDLLFAKYVMFFPNGSVSGGCLDRPERFRAAGGDFLLDLAQFDEDGNLAGGNLVSNAVARVRNNVYAVCGYVELHPDGALKSCQLAAVTRVLAGDIRFTFASNSLIEFFGNGAVSSGFLAFDHAVRVKDSNYTFNSNSYISFTEEGQVQSGYTKGNQFQFFSYE